jgi:hypothetical protein
MCLRLLRLTTAHSDPKWILCRFYWWPPKKPATSVNCFVNVSGYHLKQKIEQRRNCVLAWNTKYFQGKLYLETNNLTQSTVLFFTEFYYSWSLILWLPNFFEIWVWAGHQWLTPIILATQEAEIRRISVWSQPGQIVHETLPEKKPITKNGWWSGLRYRPWVQAPVQKYICATFNLEAEVPGEYNFLLIFDIRIDWSSSQDPPEK